MNPVQRKLAVGGHNRELIAICNAADEMRCIEIARVSDPAVVGISKRCLSVCAAADKQCQNGYELAQAKHVFEAQFLEFQIHSRAELCPRQPTKLVGYCGFLCRLI